ncbi:MAG: hypothetical protein HY925_13740 [Elusimicrobia bacterium]|nr:hypothetical protein [Elusimicrobiota bacterium]
MTLFSLLLLGAVGASAATPGAKISRVDGAAVVRRASGASEPAAPGNVLGPGDRVATAEGADAVLEFPGGVEIDLGSDSILELAGPEPVRGLRLVLRDGSQELLDPESRILLSWPKAGDPSANDGRPDFRVVLAGPVAPPELTRPETLRDAPSSRPSSEPNLPVEKPERPVSSVGPKTAP